MPSQASYYNGFSVDVAPFDDERVRQAFVAAVDRQAMLDDAYSGSAFAALTFTPPTVFGYVDGAAEGVGIPYNARFMSFEELEAMGRALCRIDPRTQVCVLDYRPEYRRFTGKAEPIERPDSMEMRRVFDLLRSTGLKMVLCQTPFGHIGPR